MLLPWIMAVAEADDQSITLIRAIVIGIVQGLTEFLPISSTAHVKVVPVVLGWGDPGVSFTAVIQLGSVAAILWYFLDDLSAVTMNFLGALFAKRFESSEFQLGTRHFARDAANCGGGNVSEDCLYPGYEDSVVRSPAAIAVYIDRNGNPAGSRRTHWQA